MTSSSSKKTPATPAEYITSLELLVQAYRTDYELCILCGGDREKKEVMCSECSETAKEGDQLKLKELEE